MKQKCTIQTPLGEMIALAEQNSLCELRFIGQKYAPEDAGEWQHTPDHFLFVALRSQLDAYFAGQLRAFDLPLAPTGTAFQVAVWALLLAIPSGTTSTYGALAKQLSEWREGRIPSAQAVGGAVGHNPIAIIIPCHRVIGADGSLTGYAGGLERKGALLALENVKN
jgi:methylated-DNA-[protein]-cysteine S-methyltransferase